MKIKQLTSKTEWNQIVKLRREVFVKEQGVPLELELDGKDDTAVHFLAVKEGEIVATCRVRTKNKQGKLERMAVKKEFRGRGIGSELITYVINFAQKEELDSLILHAQKQVVNFYQQNSFEIVSPEIIEEAGIEHLRMKREL